MAEKKLIEKYVDHVFFTEMEGNSDIVCLEKLADLILDSSWYEKREKDLAKELGRIEINEHCQEINPL